MLNDRKARPFCKWVGGKGKLLPILETLLPVEFNDYYEPFAGGAALYFHLCGMHGTGPKWNGCSTLIDINQELIDTYTVIARNVGDLVARLKEHAVAWKEGGKPYYYQVRAQDPARLTLVEKAARFIFLNKTCFNGLYRVNQLGKFNAPAGDYKNPAICDEENLRVVSVELKQNVVLRCGTYEYVLDMAWPGDFVYFDPPYMPITETSSFMSYTPGGFGRHDQHKLSEVYRKLAEKRVKVMLSNSAAPLIRELYAGFDIRDVAAGRSINCQGNKRGAIREVVVLSYKPANDSS